MSNIQNHIKDQKTVVEDWTTGTIRFARLPLEVLRMGLTLNQLKVFLVIASYANRDGSTGTFSPCQDTVAEVLNWFSNNEPDRNKVSKNLQPLLALEIVKAKPSPGINQKYHYFLNMPKDIKIDLTNRSSPEYLAQAKAKRQEILENYKKAKKEKQLQIKNKLAELTADSDFPQTQSYSEYDELYENVLTDEQSQIIHELHDGEFPSVDVTNFEADALEEFSNADTNQTPAFKFNLQEQLDLLPEHLRNVIQLKIEQEMFSFNVRNQLSQSMRFERLVLLEKEKIGSSQH